jgi:hypothetical protein
VAQFEFASPVVRTELSFRVQRGICSSHTFKQQQIPRCTWNENSFGGRTEPLPKLLKIGRTLALAKSDRTTTCLEPLELKLGLQLDHAASNIRLGC